MKPCPYGPAGWACRTVDRAATRPHAPGVAIRSVASAILWEPNGRRGVAQPGSALRSGRRGRRFKSSHPDLLRWLPCAHGSHRIFVSPAYSFARWSASPSPKIAAAPMMNRSGEVLEEIVKRKVRRRGAVAVKPDVRIDPVRPPGSNGVEPLPERR